MDLIVIILLTIITFPVVALTDGIPRVVLGIVFIFIIPGYSLMAALFPKAASMKGIERAALTLVLSLALVALTGLALNYTPWGIRLMPIIISMAIIIYLTSGIAFFRRLRLPESERFFFKMRIPWLHWNSMSKYDRVLSLILILVLFIFQ